MANYPAHIDDFKTHVDDIDTVEANDINKIQDTIVAIEQTIGTKPTRFEGKSTQANPGGDGQGSYGDGGSGAAGDTKKGVVNYDSISDRLDAIERGGKGGQGGNSGLPLFHLQAASLPMPPTGGNINDRPALIKLPGPDRSGDPYQMWDGYGVTLPRDGFWVFHGSIILNYDGNPDSKNFGIYNLVVDVDSDWLRGATRYERFVTSPAVVLATQTHRAGFFTAGQHVTLRASHSAQVTQTIRVAVLSGFMLKES